MIHLVCILGKCDHVIIFPPKKGKEWVFRKGSCVLFEEKLKAFLYFFLLFCVSFHFSESLAFYFG